MKDHKIYTYKFEGNSMFPLLKHNDIIACRKTTFQEIVVNDLIPITRDEITSIQRVIYKNEHYLVTKGDNKSSADRRIYPNQITAKLYQVKRKGKIFYPDNIYFFQSALYFREIVKIKKAFEQQRITHVFLKGLPLHLYFERSRPRRIYADCDVLVDNINFSRAEAILLQNGYTKLQTSIGNIQNISQDKKTENAYSKMINNMPVVFDLHAEIVFMMTQLSSFNLLYAQRFIDFLTKECLRTKRQILIQGETFFILNSPFLILYLALHIFHHNFSGSFRYDFLDKVIKKTPNLDQILKQVQDDILRFQLQNFVYPVFILLKKYYQTPIKARFLRVIQPVNQLTCWSINRILRAGIFHDEQRIQGGITRFTYLFYLSPNPWWKKMFIFIQPQVVYAILWVIINKVRDRGGQNVKKA